MKSLMVGAGMAPVCSVAVWASGAETKPAAKAAAEHHENLASCLGKGPEPTTFTLNDMTSEHAKGPKEWEPVGASADPQRSEHVGHGVEVRGMASRSTSTAHCEWRTTSATTPGE
jgi:hypothetical protein